MQPRHQVQRHERAIPRHRHDPCRAGRVRRRPVHSGDHPRQRPGPVGHGVRHHRQPQIGEPRRVVVGVHGQPGHLRRHAPHQPVQQPLSADQPQPLVAAAHPAGQAASQDDAECRRVGHVNSPLLWRFRKRIVAASRPCGVASQGPPAPSLPAPSLPAPSLQALGCHTAKAARNDGSGQGKQRSASSLHASPSLPHAIVRHPSLPIRSAPGAALVRAAVTAG